MTEGLQDRLVALTRDLILIPSTAARPEECERCFEFIRNHLEQLEGITLQEHRCNAIPSLLALPAGVERPEVLLCGHLDVIGHPDWSVYRSQVEEGRIIGPGAGDMKGPLAILLELFRELHETDRNPSLGLLVTSDEECGGQCGVRYLFEDVGFRCGVAMIPDGGGPAEITVEEKGVLHVGLRQHGHAAHAARPWSGCNALEGLMDALTRVRARFQALASASEGEHWHPTCAVTVLSTANDTTNRIPADAAAELDIRFPPPHTVASMLQLLDETLGDGITVEPRLSAEPAHLSPDPLFLEATRAVTGTAPRLVREPGGSDGRFICRFGIPVLMSRPLVGEVHSEEEWIDIASMVTFYRICRTYLEQKLGLSAG